MGYLALLYAALLSALVWWTWRLASSPPSTVRKQSEPKPKIFTIENGGVMEAPKED